MGIRHAESELGSFHSSEKVKGLYLTQRWYVSETERVPLLLWYALTLFLGMFFPWFQGLALERLSFQAFY